MKKYEIKISYQEVGEMEDHGCFTTPQAAFLYIKDAFQDRPDQEQMWVILLDGANQPKGRLMITMGLANRTQVHAREVFKYAIREGAVSIILAHNHPSGKMDPSMEDIRTTQKLVEVGNLIEIPVLDHLIVSDRGFRSIREHDETLFH
jgi:DNA repair protein RadC